MSGNNIGPDFVTQQKYVKTFLTCTTLNLSPFMTTNNLMPIQVTTESMLEQPTHVCLQIHPLTLLIRQIHVLTQTLAMI